MNRKLRWIGAAALILSALGPAGRAQTVPEMINYQGRLLDGNGAPLVGNKDLAFSIYDAAAAGTLLWGPQTIPNVPLFDGNFNVALGPADDVAAPLVGAFAGANAFLSIRFGEPGEALGAELTPRQQILSVPYALRSLESDTTNVGDQLDEILARLDALEAISFPPGAFIWSDGIGGAGTSAVFPLAAAADSSGDVLVAGMYRGTVDFGDGIPNASQDASNDPFILKLSGINGSYIWHKVFPAAGFADQINGIAIDAADNAIIVGAFNGATIDFGGGPISLIASFNSDIFVVKLAGADGAHMWSHGRGGADDDDAFAVALDGAGNPVVTGNVGGDADHDLGGGTLPGGTTRTQDFFVAKYQNSDGAHIWSAVHASPPDDDTFEERGLAVDVAPNGDVVVAGSYQGPLRFGALPVLPWKGHEDFAGPYDMILVAKFNGTTGAPIWSRGFGDETQRTEQGRAVQVDADGNVYFAGMFDNTVNFGGGALNPGFFDTIFLVKFDADANHLWSKAFAGQAPQGSGQANALALDAAGNPIIAGHFSGTVNFGGAPLVSPANPHTAFLAKFAAADGAHVYSKEFDQNDEGQAWALAARSGRLFIAGEFQGSIDLGGGPFAAAGTSFNAFVGRFRE